MGRRTRAPKQTGHRRSTPQPIPHPDDIVIDMSTGLVRVKGPMTREDKVRWDQLRSLKVSIKTDIEELRCLLAEESSERDQIEAEIQHSERVLKIISAVIED
jgi:DnaJ-domain-containing protein 1